MVSPSAVALSLFAGALATGFTGAVLQTSIGDFPLKEIVGYGSGGIVATVVWVFLKRDDAVRKEHQETIRAHHDATKAVATEFAQTTKALGSEFSETTATLLREARVEAAQREDRLARLFDAYTKDKP